MVELEGQHSRKVGAGVREIVVAVCALLSTDPPTRWDWLSQDRHTQLELEIVREHNLVRTDPAGYAVFLEELRGHFDGNLYDLPGRRVRVTREGVAAVDEAIRFLREVAVIGPVSVSRGMSLGAQDLVRDQGHSGATGHLGADGSQVWDRVNRYGNWQGSIAENIAYGYDTARDVLMQLIIDDGVKERSHRMNIFNENFQVAGVSCGKHARYDIMCVITYANGYTEGRQ
jgi:uncharacterized protein YkwD